MRFSTVVAALLPLGVAYAETHVVKVGDGGAIAYDPPQLTNIQNGDVVQFMFMGGNHSVTQSTFVNPCSNITDGSGTVTGVDSGFQLANDPNNIPRWQITVNNASQPLWFFCRQGPHCQKGMVFAINPTQDKTYEAFVAKAANSAAANGGVDPNAPQANPPASSGTDSATSTNGAPPSSGSAAPPATNTGASAPPATNTGAVSGSTPTDGADNSTDTPQPTAGATGDNGAGVLRFGSSAALMSVAGLALGLLL